MGIRYWDANTTYCLAVIEQSDIVYAVPRVGERVLFGNGVYVVEKITHNYTTGAPDQIGCFTIVGDEGIDIHVTLVVY